MQHLDSESPLPVPVVNHHETTIEDPPESFWLSKNAEFDWFDQNAFLERKESLKGNMSSHSNSSSMRYSVTSNTSSQRYLVSSKKKAPVIGLPKTQKTTYVDLKCRRCKPLNVRMFPKQLYTAPARVQVTEEPSSPKVSCIGRVRSMRCQNRKKTPGLAVEPEITESQRSGTGRSRKTGLMCRIMSIFCFSGGQNRKEPAKVNKPVASFGSRRICVTVQPVNSEPETPVEPGTPVEPAGLGGMMRFASGRR